MTRARDLAAGTFEQATGGVLKLETSDTTVTDGSVLGKIEFKAPDEASGTDAILVGAAIEAVAEGTFAADNNATELVFKTGASAAADAKMTLTSGGNLLVGTTDAAVGSSSSVTGGVISAAGIISNGVDGNVCAVLNRQSSDGEILRFRKAGTTVGSIGTKDGDLTIGTGDTGLYFSDGADAIYPFNMSTNADRDAAVDIGYSTVRWKDLYLSGGVYLGGTGAANKLSDYEEGLMTATLTADSGTITVSSANDILNYIKIGGLVSLTGRIRTSAVSSPSGKVKLNLPFVIADLAEDSNRASGTLYLQNGTGAINSYGIHPTSDANQYIEIGRIDGTAFDLQIGDEFDGNELLYFSIQYRAA